VNIAILDLGTNTFNLLIANLTSGKPEILAKRREVVKLGEGSLDQNKISEAGFKRGLQAIDTHLHTIHAIGCDTILAVATSGIRSTINGKDFLTAVQTIHKLTVEIIDGSREAELIWKGVKHCLSIHNNTLIIDIGGGSTEFIIAHKHGILYKESFKLGVSRLKELFKPKDPISTADLEALELHFNTTLKTLKKALIKYPCHLLVGCSGSFDTFCEMALHRKGKSYLFDKSETLPIAYTDFIESYNFLMQSTLDQRLKTPGLLPMRADMIVLSGHLTRYILELSSIHNIKLSKYALKEGLMFEQLECT